MSVCERYFLEKAVLYMFIKQSHCPWCSHRGETQSEYCTVIESDIPNQGPFFGGMKKHTNCILEWAHNPIYSFIYYSYSYS